MSLKSGISHKELSDTIADAQKDKKGVAEKLDPIAKMKERMEKKKKSKKREQVLCCVLSIAVLLCSAESSLDYLAAKYDAEIVAFYFFLYLWSIFYVFAYDPNSKQFSELERENKILKEKIRNYEKDDVSF